MSETVLRCHYDGLQAENAELCKKVEQQRGECLMLADMLRDAYEVVKTIEGEEQDECDKLSDLRMSIEYALAAYEREAHAETNARLTDALLAAEEEVFKWKRLAESNAALVEISQRRIERESRLGLEGSND